MFYQCQNAVCPVAQTYVQLVCALSPRNRFIMANETILPIWQCYFLESPDNSYTEFVFVSPYGENETIVRCVWRSEYLFGKQNGPVIGLVLGVMITIIGLVGAIANATNVMVLKLLTKNSSLYCLLLLLAIFDFLLCSFAIVTTIFLQVAISKLNTTQLL